MKRIYLTIFLCCILLSSCNNLKTGNKNVPITQIEWDNITERVTLEAIKLPTLCNIENMAALDSFILLENRLMEPCFVLWDRVNSEKFFSFGEEGNGPEDFLPTAMLVQSTEKTILEYGMVTQSENTNIKGIHLHLTPRNWIAPM
jgi:hypothetical protein